MADPIVIQDVIDCPNEYIDDRRFKEAVLALLGSTADPNAGAGSANTEYYESVALGNITGVMSFALSGNQTAVTTTSTPEDIWNVGGEYTGQPLSFTPDTVDVVSTSVNDTSAGSGARTVRLYGLESPTSTSYTTEDIILNGTTPVTSTNTWWRINQCYVVTAGATGYNEGTISATATGTPAVQFFGMPVDRNQTEVAAATVPAGHNFILKRFRVNIGRTNGSAGQATVTFRVREPGGVYRALRDFDMTTEEGINFTQITGDVLPPGTDMKFRIESISDNTVTVDAFLEGLLVAI